MKKTLIGVGTGLVALTPMLASAQMLGNITNLTGAFGTLVNTAIPIVMALAVLAFFWGLVKFIFNAGNEEAQKGAKSLMIYSVVALLVMTAIWGIITYIANDLGIQQNSGAPVVNTPQVIPR
jgi:Type IV secretion system pilin